MLKKCVKHPNATFATEKSGLLRCRACRVEAVARRRRKVKLLLVAAFGGKCSVCGYSKCAAALQFHHKDPATKSFGIAASGLTKSYKRLQTEAEKCILLCSNCHAEIHNVGP